MRDVINRHRSMLAVVLGGVFLVAGASSAPAAAQDVGLPIGSVPDAVQLEDLDGAPVDLADYIGRKPVLVQFWATWCPLCAALEPKFQAVSQRYGDGLDVLVVAVGVNQTQRSIRRHMERHEMPGRVLFDGRGRAVSAFKAPTTSYVVALDANGRVVYTGVGGDQDIAGAAARAVGSR